METAERPEDGARRKQKPAPEKNAAGDGSPMGEPVQSQADRLIDESLLGLECSSGFTPGAGQNLGPASEALQIAGQIVAKRASGAALDLARTRLLDAFCDSDSKQAGAKQNENQNGNLRAVQFPRTCSVIRTIRLQDLAGSGRALVEALLADAFTHALGKLPASARVAEPLALQTVLPALVPELVRAAEGHGSAATTSAAVRQVFESSFRALALRVKANTSQTPPSRKPTEGFTKGEQALLVSAAAIGLCLQTQLPVAKDGEVPPLGSCNVSAFVADAADSFEIGDAETIYTAERLATYALEAMTLNTQDAPDWQGRTLRTLDVAFGSACLALSAETLTLCPGEAPPKTPQSQTEWLSAMHYLLASVVERDVNGLLTTIGALLPCQDEQNETCREHRRALRITGALLRYAQTYTSGKNDSDAHAERVELLEDLSADMTDRVDREGDWVFSLGGSLQGVAGVRWPSDGDDPAFWGPVALPLGLGLQTVGSGLHVGVGLFDLGQYLAWHDGPEVREPELEDALSPSLTIGYTWGTSFPAFVGVSAGYTPSYESDDPDSTKGSFQVGGTVGVYVPLLDLN